MRAAILESTVLCNSRCVMCPNRFIERAPFMPVDAFKRVADEAYDLGAREFSLSQYGEPLIDPDLETRIAYLRRHDVMVMLFTNGSLMSRDRAKSLIDAGLTNCAFSLDGGTKETYERIRVGLDFDTVVANIRNFIATGCETRVHQVIMEANQHERVEFEGADNSIGFCEGRWGVPAYTDQYTDEPCVSPFQTLTVLTNGEVPVCCQDWDGKYTMGNAFTKGVAAVWDGHRYNRFRHRMLNGHKRGFPLCRECKARY